VARGLRHQSRWLLGKKIEYQQIPFEAFEQQAGEEVTIFRNSKQNHDR
jgi:hypothetical protein